LNEYCIVLYCIVPTYSAAVRLTLIVRAERLAHGILMHVHKFSFFKL